MKEKMDLAAIKEKVQNCQRITREEGVAVLQQLWLLDLGELANLVRYAKNPQPRVTFVIDTNPNYTNICNVDCIFCAFYHHPGDGKAFTYTVDEMIQKLKKAAAMGATTALLQGGVNSALPLEYYLEMVERTIKEIPEIHPHFYSTTEIIGMSEVAELPVPKILKKLWDAGLRTIPGGGAEVLSDRVRKKMGHKKGTAEDWLRVMREAHKIGFKTTATMMYGHLENDEEIVDHLDRMRALQDEYHGFTAFIPWSFKPGNTPLEKIIPNHAVPVRYLQMIALSRIYLDNFDHIQASWFSEGKKIGQIALHFGADDFGGTLIEEHVHAAANFINKTSTEEVIELIRGAGFTPAQRTAMYKTIKLYGREPAVQSTREILYH